MGTKRIGLARVEALMENLKRDIAFGLGTGGLAGLHSQWNCNFGGLLAGQDQSVSTLNVLTPGTVALNLAKQLESLSTQQDVVSVADAAKIFGGVGIIGADVAIGTSGAPGATPTVTQRVSRLTGGISGTVTMTTGADMTTAGDETLILFTENVFSNTGVLKLDLHADNGLDAESTEVFITADGTDVLTRVTVPTDGDTLITITDSGDCTILAGSYIYLHAGNNTDVMSCKGVIRTSGGTVGVTFAA